MKKNTRYIDADKLTKLVESIRHNTAGPKNKTQLEEALGLSKCCIGNAARRGVMNVNDVNKLESYFNAEITAAKPADDKPAEPRPADSEGMRLLRENNRILKQLAELWLSGKEV